MLTLKSKREKDDLIGQLRREQESHSSTQKKLDSTDEHLGIKQQKVINLVDEIQNLEFDKGQLENQVESLKASNLEDQDSWDGLRKEMVTQQEETKA